MEAIQTVAERARGLLRLRAAARHVVADRRCTRWCTTHITIAGVTIFLHRCQAHRALDLGPIPSHFFRFWLWLTTGMVTKEWVAIHRKHHAKCETVDDPHSPQSRAASRPCCWRGAELYRAESKNKETIAKFGHGTPDDWIERNLYTRFQLAGRGADADHQPGAVRRRRRHRLGRPDAVDPDHRRRHHQRHRPLLGLPQLRGRRRARNISPWGIIIGGEELHNNHHTYPTSAKFSVKPYEFDIGWVYIRAHGEDRLGQGPQGRAAAETGRGPSRWPTAKTLEASSPTATK